MAIRESFGANRDTERSFQGNLQGSGRVQLLAGRPDGTGCGVTAHATAGHALPDFDNVERFGNRPNWDRAALVPQLAMNSRREAVGIGARVLDLHAVRLQHRR